jgi:hypothetical protein
MLRSMKDMEDCTIGATDCYGRPGYWPREAKHSQAESRS